MESVVKPELFQQELFPDWANHMMHTTPVLGMALEMVLSDHRYPGAELGVLTTASVSMSYLVWICYIASVSGEWVYPVLRVMSPVQRSIFLLTCGASSGLLYFAGEKIHSILWTPKGEGQKSEDDAAIGNEKAKKM